jgi:hypothetical protein
VAAGGVLRVVVNLVKKELIIDAQYLVLEQGLIRLAAVLVRVRGRTLGAASLSLLGRFEQLDLGCKELGRVVRPLAYESVDLRTLHK